MKTRTVTSVSIQRPFSPPARRRGEESTAISGNSSRFTSSTILRRDRSVHDTCENMNRKKDSNDVPAGLG